MSDELYLAIRPVLAVSQGDLWLMSTPFGKRGFFYDAWVGTEERRGGQRWERICVPATECPRIPPETLADERATMGERWFRQEYLCEFTETSSGVFDPDVVDRAIRWDIKPLIIP